LHFLFLQCCFATHHFSQDEDEGGEDEGEDEQNAQSLHFSHVHTPLTLFLLAHHCSQDEDEVESVDSSEDEGEN